MYTYRIELVVLAMAIFSWTGGKAQKPPRLVVGIVVDQMRSDYVQRFWNDFGDGGFKKLANEGAYFPNTYYTYVPTYTGPGHASIYCGSPPSVNGIVANEWLDRSTGKVIYCVSDSTVTGTGTLSELGQRSPANLLVNNLSDDIKSSSHGKSLVASVALKDRSAILPGGHAPDMAFWWDDEEGKWITSSYYMEKIPDWLVTFQEEHSVQSYLKVWDEISPLALRDTSHNSFENAFILGDKTDFPYDIEAISKKSGLGILKYTPWGNTYTLDMAAALLEATDLGEDDASDLLAVSLSSTDYIGHRFGPYSDEVRDTYIRLDKELEKFLNMLEAKYPGEFTVFLTADHGVMPNANYWKSKGLSSYVYNEDTLQNKLNKFLHGTFGVEDLVTSVMGRQVYLDEKKLEQSHIDVDEAERMVIRELMSYNFIALALASSNIPSLTWTAFPATNVVNGFYRQRSGNVIFVLEEYTVESSYSKGASHGSPYSYDCQVPLLFYGKDVKKTGEVQDRTDVLQITPTVSDLLGIPPPENSLQPSLKPYFTR